MQHSAVTAAVFALMALFVAWVEGFLNPFWIWNCLPIAIGYWLVTRRDKPDRSMLPEAAFVFVACGLTMLAHAAWLFDWGGTATGSSTSGLMFVVLPVYASALGGAAFAVTWLFARKPRQE